MISKSLSKSIDYLLNHAGPVIRYRLKKDILGDITPNEEACLLSQIRLLPHFRLVSGYQKPDGYIGSGMHSWGRWRGRILHETPLQDGENAARLLCNYRIPKHDPLVERFVRALRDEQTLKNEFSYIPPEITRYQNRFVGLNNGNFLMAIVYAMEAMLGYGDDFEDTIAFQKICLRGFERILEINGINDITRLRESTKSRYNYPYITSDAYFPDIYTLSMLAYTSSWRSDAFVRLIADAFNRINAIMKDDTNIHVKIGSNFYAPCFAFARPLRAFRPDLIDSINYRRLLTEIAMTGVGSKAEILKTSAENILSALDLSSVLKMDFSQPHNRRYSPLKIEYPGAYTDVRLEADYKDKNAVFLDLTFWAVELISLIEKADRKE